MPFPDPFLRNAAREKGMSPSRRWQSFRESVDLWQKLVTAKNPDGWERVREESRAAHRAVWRQMMALRRG